mmetsp:Transcript_22179/g.33534  ORF Transcript_22179/g.33534 Transcript_22179/m.33534 type:complete len:109 (-) Transcript_22179:740-1066(-)
MSRSYLLCAWDYRTNSSSRIQKATKAFNPFCALKNCKSKSHNSICSLGSVTSVVTYGRKKAYAYLRCWKLDLSHSSNLRTEAVEKLDMFFVHYERERSLWMSHLGCDS